MLLRLTTKLCVIGQFDVCVWVWLFVQKDVMPNERNIQCAIIKMGEEGVCVCVCAWTILEGTNEWPVRGHSIVEQAIQAGISSRTSTNPQTHRAHLHTSNNNYYYKLPLSNPPPKPQPLSFLFVLDSCILNAPQRTVWSGSHMTGGLVVDSTTSTHALPRFPLYRICCVCDRCVAFVLLYEWFWLHYFPCTHISSILFIYSLNKCNRHMAKQKDKRKKIINLFINASMCIYVDYHCLLLHLLWMQKKRHQRLVELFRDPHTICKCCCAI